MDAQFTPGPWRVSSAKPTKTRGIDILNGYAATVSHVPVPPSYMPSRAQADARLIASAPDLLAVLQRLLTAAAYVDALPGDKDGEIVAAAHAAIAKATGK